MNGSAITLALYPVPDAILIDASIQSTIPGIARPALYLIPFASKGVQHQFFKYQRVYFAQISQTHRECGAWIAAVNIRNAGNDTDGLVLTESVAGFLARLAAAGPGDKFGVHLFYNLHYIAFNL